MYLPLALISSVLTVSGERSSCKHFSKHHMTAIFQCTVMFLVHFTIIVTLSGMRATFKFRDIHRGRDPAVRELA